MTQGFADPVLRNNMPEVTREPRTPTSHAAPTSRAQVRAFTLDDVDAVNHLFQRHGWPLRSPAGWRWALMDSPARTALQADAGWVLVSGDEVVGFLGNLPQRYRLNGRKVVGATCTSYLVDEAHRARSMGLLRAFASQPGLDFTFSVTANGHSAPVYRAFRFEACADPAVNRRLRWMADFSLLAAFALQQHGLKGLVPLVGLVGRLWQSWSDGRLELQLKASDMRIRQVGADELDTTQHASSAKAWSRWADALSGQPGLWADRSVEAYRWRLGDPDLVDHLALWVLEDAKGTMQGLCMARRLPTPDGQVPKIELMDWAFLPQATLAHHALMLAQVKQWARQCGVPVIDAKRWTGSAANALSKLSPRCHGLPGDAAWLLNSGKLHESQRPSWGDWAMTGCDSDDWFNSHQLNQPGLHASLSSVAHALQRAD